MGMVFVGRLKDGELKRWLHYQVYTLSFQILGGSLSAVITYHNPENRPKQGICVANHTSPIDVLVLACDNAYALVSIVLKWVYLNCWDLLTWDFLLKTVDWPNSFWLFGQNAKYFIKSFCTYLV